jgi:hypothetical protein
MYPIGIVVLIKRFIWAKVYGWIYITQRFTRLVTSHKHYATIFRKRIIGITDAWPGQYTDTCISRYRMAECFIELGIWCFRAVKLCYLKLRTQTQRNDLLQNTPSVTKWSRMTYFKIGPSLVSDPATHWSYHREKRSRRGGEGTSLDFSQNSY